MTTYLLCFLLLFNMSCDHQKTEVLENMASEYAVVQKVTVSGNEGAYNFSVTLLSPDEGCGQYANWWEVVTSDQELVYRRILGHSHVNEQPFTRSGGSVSIQEAEIVIIRAHMNTSGYGEGEIAMRGSVEAGFLPFSVSSKFASNLEQQDPQPSGCAF